MKLQSESKMNFLMLRSNQTAASEQPSAQEFQGQANLATKPATTLEGLIAEDLFPVTPSSDSDRERSGRFGRGNAGVVGSNANNNSSSSENHADVTEDQGWITIPYSNSLPFLFACMFTLLVCTLKNFDVQRIHSCYSIM